MVMRAIAKEAGYTAGAIYAYFPAKEALYAALLGESLDRLTAVIHAASGGRDGAGARFTAAGLAFYDFYDANPRDLDLGFYLFRGGIKPRGLTAELDAVLNTKLVARLGPLTDAALELGVDENTARAMTAEVFAHATGLLLLAHTRRLDLFGVDARHLLTRHLAALGGRGRSDGNADAVLAGATTLPAPVPGRRGSYTSCYSSCPNSMMAAASAAAGRVPKVGAQSAPSREAQKASATAGGAWRASSEPCKVSAMVLTSRRPVTRPGLVAASSKSLTAASRRGSAPVASRTSSR